MNEIENLLEVPDIVDADQVEKKIEAKQIGERIRHLRLKRSMGLIELGTKTGLSASFLSQLETGRVIPTVRNLARIAMTFNKDLSYFFREDPGISFRIMRRDERVRLRRAADASPAFLAESMSGLIPSRSMIPCIAEFCVSDENTTFYPKIFTGIEFAFVMEGNLHLIAGEDEEMLETGDAVWIDSTRKRSYTCAPGTTARAMIITRPAQT